MGLLDMMERQSEALAYRYAKVGDKFAGLQHYALAARCYQQAAEQVRFLVGSENYNLIEASKVEAAIRQSANQMSHLAKQQGQTLEGVPDLTPEELWRWFNRKDKAAATEFWEGCEDFGLVKFGIFAGIALVGGLTLACVVRFDRPGSQPPNLPLIWLQATYTILAILCGWTLTRSEPLDSWIEGIADGVSDLMEAAQDAAGGRLGAILLAPMRWLSRITTHVVSRLTIGTAVGFFAVPVIIVAMVLKARSRPEVDSASAPPMAISPPAPTVEGATPTPPPVCAPRLSAPRAPQSPPPPTPPARGPAPPPPPRNR